MPKVSVNSGFRGRSMGVAGHQMISEECELPGSEWFPGFVNRTNRYLNELVWKVILKYVTGPKKNLERI